MSAACATVGLVLVVAAALIVLIENAVIGRALHEELTDLPELSNPHEGL